MHFYLASSFIFPRSFRLRLFALCFVATHLPLLSYLGWGYTSGRLALPEVALLTLATLAGTILALLGIGAMLAPIHQAAGALATLEEGGPVAPLPQHGRDVIGSLLASVNRAASAAQERVHALDLAAKEDVLTGIRNRRGFLADIEALEPCTRGAVALIDLDHFKAVNDTLGHDEGDRVLREFAARLSSALRRHDLLARWGGEEFAVLFCHATEDEAARVLERVARTLAEAPVVVLDGQPLSFSAGVSRFRVEALGETLRAADEALYEAKHAGRNRVRRASRSEQASLPLA
jgi:diguanylate cyclase